MGGAVGPHFSCAVRYLGLLRPVVACALGSLCGVLRGVESLACVLGCLRRENQRGARTARFLYVLWSLGVAWFLRWRYFSVIVAVPLVGCPVTGARFLVEWTVRVGWWSYAFPR